MVNYSMLDACVEVDCVVGSESHDSLLVSVGATGEEAGFGVAGLVLACVVHGVDVKDLDIVELFDSLLDFNLVSPFVYDKAITIMGNRFGFALLTLDAGELGSCGSLGKSRHLLTDEGFYDNIHRVKNS